MTDGVIEHVADTAFWVAHYRAVESTRPNAMFRDSFAARLVGDRGAQIAATMPEVSRYTEWSVLSRTVIIDRFIDEAVAEGVDAVLNLGAGLDTRPYRMALPADLLWIEVDHPSIIEHKSKVLVDCQPQCRLERITADLADPAVRQSLLRGVAPTAKKVLVLTEGVIPYLSPQQVADLGRELYAESRFHHWIAEYFHPRTYRVLQRTVRTVKMQRAPFLFYPPNWFEFFENLGWVKDSIRYSGDVAVEFKRRPPMPLVARVLMPLFPERVKKTAREMTGYVRFTRRTANG